MAGPTTSDFTGVWVKDTAASDSMMEAADMMQLGALMRQAVKLIRGIEVTQTADVFEMAVFSVFPWFKMDGSTCPSSRRDFRKGGMTGHVAPGSTPEQMQLKLAFKDPHSGTAEDTFHMPGPDTLHVDSTVTTAKGSVSYRSVFHRHGSSRAQLLAADTGVAAPAN